MLLKTSVDLLKIAQISAKLVRSCHAGAGTKIALNLAGGELCGRGYSGRDK